MGGWSAATWDRLSCFTRCISRKLDWKQKSRFRFHMGCQCCRRQPDSLSRNPSSGPAAVLLMPHVGRDVSIQTQQAQGTPHTPSPKRSSPGQVVVTLSEVEDKERILKTVREKSHTYRKTSRLTPDFSPETPRLKEHETI